MKKAVIITGAARGIGRSIALSLAEDGFDIALHYNKSHQAACELKSVIEGKFNRQCHLLQYDLLEETSAKSLIQEAFSRFHHCNALVNNAASFFTGTFREVNVKEFNDNISISLRAPLFLSQAFSLNCSQGYILNILDNNLRKKGKLSKYFAYKLSKQALEYLSEMLQQELYPKIKVRTIYPDKITTYEIESDPQLHAICDQIIKLLKE